MSDRLTEKLIDALRPPKAGNIIQWDAPDPKGKGWTPGFGVRVTSAGSKAYILNYRTRSGRDRRLTIGAVGPWSLTAARTEAAALKRKVDMGEDPLAERNAVRDAPTVADLAKRFLAEHAAKKRPSTQRLYVAAVGEITDRLGSAKVAEVNVDDVERLHRRISERAPYQANRTAAVMSKMFSMAIRSGWRSDNPVKGLARNQEEKRERYLTAEELGRLAHALAETDDRQAAHVFTLLLLTGARVGEALAAKWSDFDLETGRWTKAASTTKQRKLHVVPLSPEAIDLLTSMNGEPGYLFPGRVRGEHRVNVKDAWADICRAAGISGLRIHDLRHSYASTLASGGVSLPVIGALLGHSSPVTTARYSHLLDHALREATGRVGAAVTKARKGGKVVPIRGGG